MTEVDLINENGAVFCTVQFDVTPTTRVLRDWVEWTNDLAGAGRVAVRFQRDGRTFYLQPTLYGFWQLDDASLRHFGLE